MAAPIPPPCPGKFRRCPTREKTVTVVNSAVLSVPQGQGIIHLHTENGGEKWRELALVSHSLR